MRMRFLVSTIYYFKISLQFHFGSFSSYSYTSTPEAIQISDGIYEGFFFLSFFPFHIHFLRLEHKKRNLLSSQFTTQKLMYSKE